MPPETRRAKRPYSVEHPSFVMLRAAFLAVLAMILAAIASALFEWLRVAIEAGAGGIAAFLCVLACLVTPFLLASAIRVLLQVRDGEVVSAVRLAWFPVNSEFVAVEEVSHIAFRVDPPYACVSVVLANGETFVGWRSYFHGRLRRIGHELAQACDSGLVEHPDQRVGRR